MGLRSSWGAIPLAPQDGLGYGQSNPQAWGSIPYASQLGGPPTDQNQWGQIPFSQKLLEAFAKPNMAPAGGTPPAGLLGLSPSDPGMSQHKMGASQSNTDTETEQEKQARIDFIKKYGPSIMSGQDVRNFELRTGTPFQEAFGMQKSVLNNLQDSMSKFQQVQARPDYAGMAEIGGRLAGLGEGIGKLIPHPQSPEELREQELKLGDLIARQTAQLPFYLAKTLSAEKTPAPVLAGTTVTTADKSGDTQKQADTQTAQVATLPPPKTGGGKAPKQDVLPLGADTHNSALVNFAAYLRDTASKIKGSTGLTSATENVLPNWLLNATGQGKIADASDALKSIPNTVNTLETQGHLPAGTKFTYPSMSDPNAADKLMAMANQVEAMRTNTARDLIAGGHPSAVNFLKQGAAPQSLGTGQTSIPAPNGKLQVKQGGHTFNWNSSNGQYE